MAQTQQNISSRSAYTRFMLGSIMTAYGTVRLMRDTKSKSGQMLVLLGSMKAAEGATKFCPRKAMNASIMNSNMMQKIKSGDATRGASAGAGATMNNASQSGQSASSGNRQTSGNIMQMVGKIVQMIYGKDAPQNAMAGTQSMSGGAGATGAQTFGNAAQQMTNGNTAQIVGNIAQTISPQVGQIVNDVAGLTGSQQASATNGASNTNGNTKNTSSGTSNGTNNGTMKSASASASKNSGNKQASSASGNNTPKADATKPLMDGAANKSNVDASVINASSKTAQKNAPTTNILQ
ncbi:hypothetical protein ACFVR1_01730 [Psychrobacillus sp. NPDC058041]|uniref:hypothetical protein n=1 Tax=Psychrobacillus sp. NPDC058041 TaxID=3346310 RepID=UPI0036D8B8AA